MPADVDVGNAAGLGLDERQADVAGGGGKERGGFFGYVEAGCDVMRRVDDQQPVGGAEQAGEDEERVGWGIAFAIQFQLVIELGDLHLRGD